MTTQIKIADGNRLSFEGDRLATVEEYEMGDRCIGSVFEALQPGEQVELQEGVFTLDDELDLVKMKTVSVEKDELIQDWTGREYEKASDLIDWGYQIFESSALGMEGVLYWSNDDRPSKKTDEPVSLQLKYC